MYYFTIAFKLNQVCNVSNYFLQNPDIKMVLYLKIFKNSNFFFIEFFNYICYFEPKQSS